MKDQKQEDLFDPTLNFYYIPSEVNEAEVKRIHDLLQDYYRESMGETNEETKRPTVLSDTSW